MALNFQTPQAPTLNLAPPPSSGGGGDYGSAALAQALQGIMAQRMKAKVEAQQQEKRAEAMKQVNQLLGDKAAFQTVTTTLAEHSPWAHLDQMEFSQRLQSEKGMSQEEAASFTGRWFQPRSVNVYNPQALFKAHQLLLGSGYSESEANGMLGSLTAGGFAGMGDMTSELGKEGVSLWGAQFYGQPTTSVNVNTAQERLGEGIDSLLSRGQQGMTIRDRKGLESMGIPAPVLDGMDIPDRALGKLRARLDVSGGPRVVFEGVGDDPTASMYAEKLNEAWPSLAKIAQNEGLSAITTGGGDTSEKTGRLLREDIRVLQELFQGKQEEKPKDGEEPMVPGEDFTTPKEGVVSGFLKRASGG